MEEQEQNFEQDDDSVPHEELYKSNNKKFIKVLGITILLIILGFIFYPKDSGGVMCGPICPPTGLSTYEKSCLGIKIRDNYIDGYSDLCFGIVYGKKTCYGREHFSDSQTSSVLPCDYPTYNQEIHLKQEEENKIADKEDSNNWTSYTNEELGFSLKYPEGVTIEERVNSDSTSVLIWNKESIKKAQEIGTWIPEEFSITKVSKEQIAITPEWLKTKDSGLVLQDFKELIGGKEAFVALPTELGTKTYILSTHNGTFMIHAWGYKNGRFYNEVIDTLKFSD